MTDLGSAEAALLRGAVGPGWALTYVLLKILAVLALIVVFGGSDIRPVDVVYMDF